MQASYLSGNSTTTWTNNDKSFHQTVHFSDDSSARFILLHYYEYSAQYIDAAFGCCFHCKFTSCYLSIIFVEISNATTISDSPPQVVWSANRDHPVGEDAVLTFSHYRALVLADADGSLIWSANTTGQYVSGLSINGHGNLVLFNQRNRTVWQSFDHPTDTLLEGQIFRKCQQLTSSISSIDMSSSFFHLCIDSDYLSAYISRGVPTFYLRVPLDGSLLMFFYDLDSVALKNGKLTFFFFQEAFQESKQEMPVEIGVPHSNFANLLRLDSDGGLRIYGWEPRYGWKPIHVFTNGVGWDDCQLPLKCGRYGVCQDGQCTCPVAVDGSSFFEPIDRRYPSLGCKQIDQSSLQSGSDGYQLVNFGQLSYFNYLDNDAAVPGLGNEELCKEVCVREESCKAVFFKNQKKTSTGYCYMVSEVLSILGAPMSRYDYSSSYIKVQVPSSKPTSLLLFIAPATCACMLLFIVLKLLLLKRKKKYGGLVCLQKLSQNILRFSYGELSEATDNFSQKLGGGGFGLVFKGTLRDGTVVAVKQLINNGQGTKEFLAELETVGYMHHINLVNVIGFCVENKHRIIVYEYLSNGSLDKWIFHGSQNTSLNWKPRKKILLDVAKGLAYIHEECRQRIAHLDIKPHNILLDDNFNAKISDFGMSKLINKDESQVMTGMRGTLGYLAPEWQNSRITVKADVYSFGILFLEVVSGRKILDYSQPEPDVHLLKLLKTKSSEDRLMDIVHPRCEDMLKNQEEAEHMIRLAMCCLHSDYRRRPAMSLVVKVLEGSFEFESDVTYNFRSVFSPAFSKSNAL